MRSARALRGRRSSGSSRRPTRTLGSAVCGPGRLTKDSDDEQSDEEEGSGDESDGEEEGSDGGWGPEDSDDDDEGDGAIQLYVRSGAKAALRLWLCAPVLPVQRIYSMLKKRSRGFSQFVSAH